LTIYFEKRSLVVPGDLLAEGDYKVGENTHRVGNKFYATRIGLFDFKGKTLCVIALNSFYIPKVGDIVIGTILDVRVGGWIVDIKAPQLAMLRVVDALDRPFEPTKDDLTAIFDIGDMILAKVIAYDRTRSPLLTIKEPGLGKITHGRITSITPSKIPRLIGKKGSMISILKKETGCQITIGMNGLVLVRGKNPESEMIAVKAISKIERESHTTGLTDRVVEMIKKMKEEGGVSSG